MKEVGLNDFFEIKRMSLIGSSEQELLIDLYLPLVGLAPISFLLGLYHHQSEGSGALETHKKLFDKFRIGPAEFFQYVQLLEAVGLIRTFKSEAKDGVSYFVYMLYGPREPMPFFDNVLFAGTLRKYVGDEEFNALREKYKRPSLVNRLSEVTATFETVFRPDYKDPVFVVNETMKIIGGNRGSINTGFDLVEMKRLLLQYGITESDISKKELETIESYAALYGLRPDAMADCVQRSYNPQAPFGTKVSFDALKNELNDLTRFDFLSKNEKGESLVYGTDNTAELVRLMEDTAPVSFLALRQKGVSPSSHDRQILAKLAEKYKLRPAVINALISFLLDTNHNVLSMKTAEFFADPLVREDIITAKGAMEYLYSYREEKMNKPNRGANRKGVSVGHKTNKAPEEPLASRDDLDDSDISDFKPLSKEEFAKMLGDDDEE